jgi:opacity protein-like surface antigen
MATASFSSTGNCKNMRKLRCAALFAACLAAAPAASAGDFFINSQLGQIELDSGGFDDEKSNLVQAGAGYRWGIGLAQVGLETGLGKLDELDDQTRSDYTGGYVDHAYTLSSRYAFIGANARVKPPLLPVYLIGRAGYLGLERKLDETSVDHYLDTSPVTERRASKENNGGTYVGVGVGTTILPLLDVGLMYNQYRYSQVQYDPVSDEYHLSDDKRDARSVSLTVEYRF